QCNLENTAAVAAGIRIGLDAQKKDDINVLAFAGDGATADIGVQALSGMFERGDRVIYVCYDNEAYMNTGIQGSSSTPNKAYTTTTPEGKLSSKKDMMGIVMAHKIPYAASASIAYLNDLQKKVEKASKVDGPSYLHIHTPCPTGWGYDPSLTIEIAKMAIHTGAWLLYEIQNGVIIPSGKNEKYKPIEKYLRLQSRFKFLTNDDIVLIQKEIDDNVLKFNGKKENLKNVR
ncbi:MAG: thiamine pyrophosphate-dependent enzyme, partial [Candidatus Thorarchaeota archaeon]